MEPQFQTSFIPKKPMMSGSQGSGSTRNPLNIFSVFVTIVFIITLILCGALFAYKQLLTGQIANANSELISAKDAFQPDTIKELTDVSSRIIETNRLLNSHISSSQIFAVLQSLTVKKVRFTSFTFDKTDGVFSILMGVEAQSYNALGGQQDIFSKTEFLKNPTFIDFTILDNGNISTSFKAKINPDNLTYKKTIESLNQNQ